MDNRVMLSARCLGAGLALLVGCASQSSFVRSDTVLGRVVVYRNGMAYFERFAQLDEDTLRLRVPADKVDDFLKSLTVVDALTGLPAPVSYPSTDTLSGTSLVDMSIGVSGPRPHKLRLSYVTEAPAWKPSYRITIQQGGKVELQAWAIVDNTSGEDWNSVKLGVGSSSALSFRFDLHSVRTVQRMTLQANDLFAQAPPTGESTYGGNASGSDRAQVAELSDDAIVTSERRDAEKRSAPRRATAQNQSAGPTAQGYGAGTAGRTRGAPMSRPTATASPPPPPADAAPDPVEGLASRLRGNSQNVVIEGYANSGEPDPNSASLARANKVREQLVRLGVNPTQVTAVGAGVQHGRNGGVRVVDQPSDKAKGQPQPTTPTAPTDGDAIGTSHFDSPTAMSVPRGSSAMVSILKTSADGEVVYFYDRESLRGNGTYPFRSIRIRNPTDSALETGPVTVFGEGRFIGEGLSEPIPAKSIAFIPFALDRQLVVETKASSHDTIQRILAVQRGVFSAEVRHTRKTVYTVFNRSAEKVTLYLRHTLGAGFTLSDSTPSAERLGGSHLFRAVLDATEKKEVTVAEETPLFRSTDIRSKEGMDLVRVFLSSAAAEGPLKAKFADLVKLQQEIGNVEQRIATVRDQMAEYRGRLDELHAQIVTLRAVKTAGPLMQDLEKKMQEMGDRVSKSTIELVGLQERLMVTRIKFQDGVAELTLERKEKEK